MRFLFRPRCASDVASSWLHAVLHCGAAVFSGHRVGLNRAQDKEISKDEVLYCLGKPDVLS